MRIIDCHCHIYPNKIATAASKAIGDFYKYKMFNVEGSVSLLLKNGKAAGITDYLVHSVATTPKQVKSINEFIAENVKEHSEFFGFGTLHPDSDNQEENVEHIISLGLKGVKLHPDFIQTALDSPSFMKIFELLEGRLPVCVHTGDKRFDYTNPDRVKHVLDTFPNLTFIGAHFGGHSVWDDAIKILPGYENLYVDTSSSLAFMSADQAKKLIRAFGSDKVLFGSDFPMWIATDELRLMQALNLTDEEYEQIYHKNAELLFNL